MTSSATTRNRLEKQGTGDNANTWGTYLNGSIDLIDAALDGRTAFSLSGSKTLTSANYAADESRERFLDITGGTGGTVTIPAVEKWYIVRNASSGDVVFTTGSGVTQTVKSGSVSLLVSDGTNIRAGVDKGYVDNAIAQAVFSAVLPEQTGNAGKYITTDGIEASWGALAAVANSGAYADLTGVPTALSAFTNDSGFITTAGARSAISATGSLSYDSATGVVSYTAPTLATVATTGAYSDLTGKPAFATVATTGAYSDLTGKPTLPSGAIVGTTDTQTLTNKTLTDPKISLGGTNGTSGQVLTSQGAGLAPAWATIASSGPTWVLLQTIYASGSSTISFTGFSNTYENYVILVNGAYGSGLNNLLMTFNGSTSNYLSSRTTALSGGSSLSTVGSDTSSFTIAPSLSSFPFGNMNAFIEILGARGSGTPSANWRSIFNNGSSRTILWGSGVNSSISSITSLQFLMNAGVIDGGTFYLYGIKKV